MKNSILIIISVIVPLFLSSHVYAIYQWVDEKGQVHISDYPKPTYEQNNTEKTLKGERSQLTTTVSNENAIQRMDLGSTQPSTGIISRPQFDQTGIQRSLASLGEQILSFVFLGFCLFVAWIFALIDIIRSKFYDNTNKILWFFFVFLLAPIGVILYFLIGRQQKIEVASNRDTEMPRRRPRNLDLE